MEWLIWPLKCKKTFCTWMARWVFVLYCIINQRNMKNQEFYVCRPTNQSHTMTALTQLGWLCCCNYSDAKNLKIWPTLQNLTHIARGVSESYWAGNRLLCLSCNVSIKSSQLLSWSNNNNLVLTFYWHWIAKNPLLIQIKVILIALTQLLLVLDWFFSKCASWCWSRYCKIRTCFHHSLEWKWWLRTKEVRAAYEKMHIAWLFDCQHWCPRNPNSRIMLPNEEDQFAMIHKSSL